MYAAMLFMYVLCSVLTCRALLKAQLVGLLCMIEAHIARAPWMS